MEAQEHLFGRVLVLAMEASNVIVLRVETLERVMMMEESKWQPPLAKKSPTQDPYNNRATTQQRHYPLSKNSSSNEYDGFQKDLSCTYLWVDMPPILVENNA